MQKVKPPTKTKGIDSRDIKCCSTDAGSIESGISFEMQEKTPVLNFHFLEIITGKNDKNVECKILHQTTKSMHLNKKSIKQLIKQLNDLL